MRKKVENLRYKKKTSIMIWLLFALSVAVIILFNSVAGLLIYAYAFVRAFDILRHMYRQQDEGLVAFIKKSQIEEEDLCTTGVLVVVVASAIFVILSVLIYWEVRDCHVFIDWLQS